jgi:hypothetical protein
MALAHIGPIPVEELAAAGPGLVLAFWLTIQHRFRRGDRS